MPLQRHPWYLTGKDGCKRVIATVRICGVAGHRPMPSARHLRRERNEAGAEAETAVRGTCAESETASRSKRKSRSRSRKRRRTSLHPAPQNASAAVCAELCGGLGRRSRSRSRHRSRSRERERRSRKRSRSPAKEAKGPGPTGAVSARLLLEVAAGSCENFRKYGAGCDGRPRPGRCFSRDHPCMAYQPSDSK